MLFKELRAYTLTYKHTRTLIFTHMNTIHTTYDTQRNTAQHIHSTCTLAVAPRFPPFLEPMPEGISIGTIAAAAAMVEGGDRAAPQWATTATKEATATA